jgi:hypothetical protein
MARVSPPLLQPLPRQVKPFPAETSASYVARLAHANRLDAEALRYYITSDRRRSPPMPAARLAVVTGIPAQVLRYAIPDLDPDPPGTTRALASRDDNVPGGTPSACAASR